MLLAAKRWFEYVDGGDPEIFDRLPTKLKVGYCEQATKIIDLSVIPYYADPKRVYMFGRPLAA